MKYIKTIIILILIIFLGYLYLTRNSNEIGQYDSFAQCIKDSEAKFYGSYQCIHCKTQKEMFGSSQKYLPYVECGPLGGPQTLTCQQAGITGYPTWDFPDGERLQGSLSFDVISKHTNCTISI